MASKSFDLHADRVRPSWATSIIGSAFPDSHLTCEGEPEIGTHGMVGHSPALKAVLDSISVVAPTDSTVLILGETGTGKELAARAIHDLSDRCHAPFCTVNCAAIPSGLLESELFGHERGAFTGAITQRVGRFEAADGGTLFLDEIGDMPLDLQVKLLRVLQEKEFERLGSTRSSRVDVRVVAATNRDLLQMIETKQFRADLYYRLNVFPISLPPLRDRPEDIPALARHFIAKSAERMNKVVEAIRPETMQAMLSCDWPGNIRELQNFIEHGVIVSGGPVFQPDLIRLRHLRARLPDIAQTLEDATRTHILEVLDQVSWVIGGRHGAASLLGIPRTTLIYKMRRLGIDSRHGATCGKSAASLQRVRVSGGAGNTLYLPKLFRQQPTRTLPGHPTLPDLERDHIIKALEETNLQIGGPNGAAERLGMARTSLIYRMKKFGIPRHPSYPAAVKPQDVQQTASDHIGASDTNAVRTDS